MYWMVNKRKGKSEFVNRLDEAVQKTRNHEEWRMECMTLLMRDNKVREEFIIRMEKAGYRGRRLRKQHIVFSTLI